MRKAFTMIELIFVIVILGILSAVAIPKLAATRDDADAVEEIANAKQIIQDAQADFIATGSFGSYPDTKCFSYTAQNNDLIVKVINKSSDLCTNALKINADLNKTYTIGGNLVKY